MVEMKNAIKNAIAAFSQGDLYNSSLHLFDTLGYNTGLRRRFDDTSFASFFNEYVRDNDNIADPEKFKEKAQSNKWQRIELLFQITSDEMNDQAGLFDNKRVDGKEINSFLFFALELEAGKYSRTALADITRQINKCFPMPVIILFKYGRKLTLSVIPRRLNKRDESKDVLEKVTLIKDIDITNSHRAHIDILLDLSLPELRNETPITNFAELQEAWRKTLNLDKLNRNFYKKVSAWYYHALKTIKLPIRPDYYKNDSENVKYFAVRLISRLLFSWFIKEMGLIDEDLLEIDISDRGKLFKDAPGEKEFLQKNTYYRAILQNIFFSCLNTPQKERKNFYFPEILAFDISKFNKIPFLNGGLFERLEEDNCNDRAEDEQIKVPNELFYSENIKVIVSKKERVTKGLNKIFEQYKFTVDENTPLEEEIALDPELLGLIFENLLAEIDPNTEISKTAKKATGSFYTPRKVIDYMVNETLLLYLKNYFKGQNLSISGLENLIYYEKLENGTNEFRQKIVEAIDKIKVLDPACGSGAFPMGMLHKLVRILNVVDPGNKLWIAAQLNRLPIELRAQTEEDLQKHELNYARKIGIIRNSIYGVDIQPLAVMISKLRFFISLIIEQDIDKGDEEHNYHISPLPNLETKIICADSLKDAHLQTHLFADQENIKKLIDAKARYYQNDNLSKKEKDELLDEIVDRLDEAFPTFALEITGKKMQDNVSSQSRNKEYIRKWFKHSNIVAPFLDIDIFFPELNKQGFDIVIGNPPYGGDKISDDVKEALDLGSKDPYGAFIARFLDDGLEHSTKHVFLKEKGILSFIVSDTFMTIKSHLKLREQMMRNYIHKMIRVHPGTFKATVNPVIILCERNIERTTKDIEQPRAEEEHICMMADLTQISIHENHDRFLELLYKTTAAEIVDDIEKQGDTSPVLKKQGPNWTIESSEEYAVYTYPQNLIKTNSNLPFFVGSPKLFAFMNDKTAEKKEITFNGETLKARIIPMNGKEIPIVKLGQIAEVRQGLATGDNHSYLFQNPEARGSYRSIKDYKQYVLTDEDLEKIRSDEELRLEVIDKGISKDNPNSKRYFGGRYIVPHDKGGESDADEGWMPNYYVPTDYYIDWSEWAVHRMKTYTIADRIKDNHEDKKIKLYYDSQTAAVFRNTETYFLKGITYSTAGFYAPTFRIGSASVYGHRGTTIFSDVINAENLLGIMASKLNKYFIKNNINHTVAAEAGTFDNIPIIVYLEIGKQVKQIIEKQKQNLRYDYISNEQKEIDRLVYEMYGLNEDDICEVENWYARRYPKLAKAQRENLKRLMKGANE